MWKVSRPGNVFKRRYSKSTNMEVSCEKSFTTTHFDTLPRIQKKSFAHEILDMKPPPRWLQVWEIPNPKDPHKKTYSKSTNMCCCEKQMTGKAYHYFQVPTSTPSLGLSFCWYIMKFLAQDHLYVGNMWDKFQIQKMYTKNLFHIYQRV